MEIRNRRLFILGGLEAPDAWRSHLGILTELLQKEESLMLFVADHPVLRTLLESVPHPVRWFQNLAHLRRLLGIPDIDRDPEAFRKREGDFTLYYTLKFSDDAEERDMDDGDVSDPLFREHGLRVHDPDMFLGAVFSREGAGLWAITFEVAKAPDGRETLELRGGEREGTFVDTSWVFADIVEDWMNARGDRIQRRPLRVRARVQTLAVQPSDSFDPEPESLPMVAFTLRLAWQHLAVWVERH